MKLLYIVSHPIQYQAPLLRRIAAEPGIDLRVRFLRIPQASDQAGSWDPGFRRTVRWDVPLRDGYDNELLDDGALAGLVKDADVVWLHGWQGARMRRVLALARKIGRPVLMRAENTDGAMPDGVWPRSLAKRALLRWVFDRCAAFLAIGSGNHAYYANRGISDDRIFPMPYAVDNDFFAAHAAAARPHRDQLRRQLGLPAEGRVVLYAGKLMRRKYPDVLLRAWRRLAEPQPALVFVGDGEMRSELEAEALSGCHLLGFRNQTELPALYDLADIFVLPSRDEPWGLAVNEAMASGCAVVVSDQVGCAADLVAPQWGAVVPCGDEAALCHALAELLPRAQTAGEAARNRIAQWDYGADIAGLQAALAWLEAKR